MEFKLTGGFVYILMSEELSTDSAASASFIAGLGRDQMEMFLYFFILTDQYKATFSSVFRLLQKLQTGKKVRYLISTLLVYFDVFCITFDAVAATKVGARFHKFKKSEQIQSCLDAYDTLNIK
eukprot:GHVP01054731.1.p1 GENE.GHVP01054731.1~~GHVP01054731.1.p1  ORF type:complete len:123 (+),score=11.02 GHVP01054731.1:337-705(+)